MFRYEKRLQYPVHIRKKDSKFARCLLAQYGGPAGEMSAAIQYLNQRFYMPDERGKMLLTDIGCEELGHIEMIQEMIYQLTDYDDFKFDNMDSYTLFGKEMFPSDPFGNVFSASYIKVSGDAIIDLESDMAAEERARCTYEHLMDLTDDPDILGPLSFLRQREIVHYNRFKELRDSYLKASK